MNKNKGENTNTNSISLLIFVDEDTKFFGYRFETTLCNFIKSSLCALIVKKKKKLFYCHDDFNVDVFLDYF